MQKDKNSNSDIEIGPRRKRCSNRKRLTDVGTALKIDREHIRAVIYTRVSKKKQVQGHSLDAQRNVCDEIARKRGWKLVDVYEDPDNTTRRKEHAKR